MALALAGTAGSIRSHIYGDPGKFDHVSDPTPCRLVDYTPTK